MALMEDKGNVSKVSNDTMIKGTLLPGSYSFFFNRKTQEVCLRWVKDPEKFKLPSKIFGNVEERCNRIVDTYMAHDKNMGVLLSGLKGTGKTTLAKMIVNRMLDMDIPVVSFTEIIGQTPHEQIDFLKKQKGRMCLLIDECEKVLSRDSDQEVLLNFLDGIFDGQVLTIMSVNIVKLLNENYYNRPGRIRYKFNYRGLDQQTVREVVETLLKDRNRIEEAVHEISNFKDVNFDVVTTLIDEMNLYNLSASEAARNLNVGDLVKIGYATPSPASIK